LDIIVQGSGVVRETCTQIDNEKNDSDMRVYEGVLPQFERPEKATLRR
jgi:hypothetical protein